MIGCSVARGSATADGGETYSNIEEWLTDIGMENYVNLFEAAGYINLSLCLQLNEGKLMEEVGVTVKGHRHKILKSINNLNDAFRHHSLHNT